MEKFGVQEGEVGDVVFEVCVVNWVRGLYFLFCRFGKGIQNIILFFMVFFVSDFYVLSFDSWSRIFWWEVLFIFYMGES